MLCLAAILVAAVYSDLRFHRIPNELSVLGMVAGLGLQVVAGGLNGLGVGLLGALVGLACFTPFYLRRAMGAGDVKILAAVGAFLGPLGALYAALFSLIAGALAAGTYLLWRALRASVSTIVREGFAAAGASAYTSLQLARRDRLAFALPIAIGGLTAGWLLANNSGLGTWLQ
jgi:Flp pilus assembly protein protease CpaA